MSRSYGIFVHTLFLEHSVKMELELDSQFCCFHLHDSPSSTNDMFVQGHSEALKIFEERLIKIFPTISWSSLSMTMINETIP